jgi:hypothetical protein
MYIRIDPSKSVGSDYYVLDADDSLTALKLRQSVDCTEGDHENHPDARFKGHQTITCNEDGTDLYTLLYQY